MIPSVSFSSDLLIMISGAVLSALFTYVPKFNVWFALKTDEVKQLTMLILMFVATGVVFALGCFDFLQIENFVCDKNTAAYFVYTFILAVMSNQATHKILPKPLAVKQANDVVQGDELYKGVY
jgi:hypothetical protein